MRRVRTGWVAQLGAGKSWIIEGVRADGVYIAPNARVTYVHLAGSSDGEAGPRLALPTDPVLLMELAEAFQELAEWRIHHSLSGSFHR